MAARKKWNERIIQMAQAHICNMDEVPQ